MIEKNVTSPIYKRLMNLCEKNKIKITPLCLEITGHRGNLDTWKKGNIRNDYLLKISEKFNVSTDYLLCKTDDPQSTVATLQGDVINTTKKEESKAMYKKEEVEEMLEAIADKAAKKAVAEYLKSQKSDSEFVQDVPSDEDGNENIV